MSISKNEYKRQMEKQINDLINSVLAHNCGNGSAYGGKVRIKKTLAQIIDYKIELNRKWNHNGDLNQIKFETYIAAVDGIINDIKAIFPFIDLTGIDLSWTGEEILNLILNFIDKMPVYNLEQITEIVGPREIKEKRERKNQPKKVEANKIKK